MRNEITRALNANSIKVYMSASIFSLAYDSGMGQTRSPQRLESLTTQRFSAVAPSPRGGRLAEIVPNGKRVYNALVPAI